MKRLAEYIKWYMYITTSILVVCAINVTSEGMDFVPAEILGQVLLAGLLTTLVTVFIRIREYGKRVIEILGYIFHYLALYAVMLVCGKWFGWISWSLRGWIVMAVDVANVYLLCFGVYYLVDLKSANDINKKLKEKYDD